MNSDRGNSAIIEIVRAQIQQNGPIPFASFMHQALYHPEHGYYASGRAAIGRKGDYFTNISVGPLFGRLLAAQFVEIWQQLGRIKNFVILEQGAHDGQFAHDVLQASQRRDPDFFAAMRYRIVERFPFWQHRQRQTLESFRDKVEWRDSLESFSGIHFSNELLDAMPIDLHGKRVGLDGDQFVFVEQTEPTNTKPNQSALDWIDDLSRNLIRGYAVTIDYGFAAEQFREVVQARAQHQLLDSPFDQIGNADITAHVNWSSMVHRAKKNGLSVAGFTDQHHFLTGIISTWPDLLQACSLDSTALSPRALEADSDSKTKRALQTLLHPEMLGRSFQVLALAKDVDPGAQLAGFRFARNHEL